VKTLLLALTTVLLLTTATVSFADGDPGPRKSVVVCPVTGCQ